MPTNNADVAMAAVEVGVQASVGFSSRTGPRRDNEDFAGALFGAELPEPRQEVVAAIADGIGGAKGGRIAAETAVRGFLDGFCDLPETMEVQRAGAKIVSALSGWINTMGRQDPNLAGMGCTLTALVLRGRVAHVLHAGDTRAYRLSRDRLTLLTSDHVRQRAGERVRATRAILAHMVDREAGHAVAAQPVGARIPDVQQVGDAAAQHQRRQRAPHSGELGVLAAHGIDPAVERTDDPGPRS